MSIVIGRQFTRWPILLITLLAVLAGCATGNAEQGAQQTRTDGVASASPTSAAPADGLVVEEPRRGSVGHLSSPIMLLEDGSTFDPSWEAHVTLTCGPKPGTRAIAAFDANTNDRGNPALYRTEPSGGGRSAKPVSVGSVVPPDVHLAWQIQGILLGPWEVNTIVDTCADE